MNRKTLLKILNPLLLALVANQLATGYRPRTYGAGSFRVMHKQMALLLAVAVAAHLALNLPWIKNTYWKSGSRGANRSRRLSTE